MTKRAWIIAATVGLAACDREAAFTVDAVDLAAEHPTSKLRVVLVHYGAIDEDVTLDFAAGTTQYTFATPLEVGVEYGVAAYLDLDADGACSAHPVDLPWLFTYLPALNTDFNWVPDPEESPDAWAACGWFGDGASPEPAEPGDDPL
jgi:hypothetical protein